jgi:curved DNA-binding protein CbpA
MTKKQSLYEILEVPPNATETEIRTAHGKLLQTLEDQRPDLSPDDYNLRLRLLKVAHSTLCSPNLRDAYDAHLLSSDAPAKPDGALLIPLPAAGKSAAEIRVDAMMMRADALALRADAMGLKADVLGLPNLHDSSPIEAVMSRWMGIFKKVLLTLGTLVALGMVLKIIMLFTLGHPEENSNVRKLAEDKVYLQEYYQTHGVRPASRAEAELMDAERRKKEDARRTQAQLEEEKQKSSRAEREFEEDAQRRGQQVSAELQYAQEQARQAQLLEEREKKQEERAKAEAERRRIAAEQAKWRSILRTPNDD